MKQSDRDALLARLDERTGWIKKEIKAGIDKDKEQDKEIKELNDFKSYAKPALIGVWAAITWLYRSLIMKLLGG